MSRHAVRTGAIAHVSTLESRLTAALTHARMRFTSRIFLVGALASALGTSAGAESLADAVAAAYARNPTLNRQRLEQKALDEDYVQVRAQYGPQLSVQGSSSYASQNFQNQTYDSNSGTASAVLTQPIYTGGRLRGALAAQRARVRAGQSQLRSVEQQTVRDVIAVYAAVLRDEARLSVGRENVAVLRDQLRENRARRKVGDVTLTDVGQADARLAAGESQLANLEASLAISRGQYLQVVGRNPGTLEPLPDLGALPGSIDEAFGRAEANNPDLVTAKYVEQSSSATAASTRGERMPTIEARAQAVYSNDAFTFGGSNGRRQVTGGVTVSLPLFTAGAISSRVRQADARNSADQVSIDAARRTALQDVTSAWSQLAAARAGLVAGQRQVESAQLAFAGMTREQRYGLRSTIDTLNAEQELQAAQLGLLQNRYVEYLSRADLLAAMGLLNAAGVVPDLDVYDPEANFRRVRNRGRTPLEPIAETIDRIAAPAVRRPLSAELTGDGGPRPDTEQALPARPGRDLTDKPLTPITRSRLVPASELPDGMPRTGELGPPPAPRGSPE